MKSLLLLVSVFFLSIIAGDSKQQRSTSSSTTKKSKSIKSTTKPNIKHVVVLQMENHSYDNMLGWFKLNDTRTNGLTGNEYNIDPTTNTTYYVTKNGALVDPDPDHSLGGTAEAIFGSSNFNPNIEHNISSELMNGFISCEIKANGESWAPHIMDCLMPNNVPVITTLASEFANMDAMHSAVPGPTFPNRLFTLSGTSWGFSTNDDLQTLLGWPQNPIFYSLDQANISWRVYFHDVATTWVLNYMRTTTALQNHREYISDFAKDVANGDLPAFTWIDCAYLAIPGLYNASDQHPSHDVAEGERLMKNVYETLRASSLWNDTILIITYDEGGGFYDHVAPPVTNIPNPDNITCKDCGKTPYNFTRLGIRVPTIVISPWIEANTLISNPPDNTRYYELSSIPATVHNVFNLSSYLTLRDQSAYPLNSIWENTPLTEPRTDCPMTLPTPPMFSPSHANDTENISENRPVSHLQQELLFTLEGLLLNNGELISSNKDTVTVESIMQKLQAAGALDSEAAAGRYVRKMVREHFQKLGLTHLK